jgi:hypothetical protein
MNLTSEEYQEILEYQPLVVNNANICTKDKDTLDDLKNVFMNSSNENMNNNISFFANKYTFTDDTNYYAISKDHMTKYLIITKIKEKKYKHRLQLENEKNNEQHNKNNNENENENNQEEMIL